MSKRRTRAEKRRTAIRRAEHLVKPVVEKKPLAAAKPKTTKPVADEPKAPAKNRDLEVSLTLLVALALIQVAIFVWWRMSGLDARILDSIRL